MRNIERRLEKVEAMTGQTQTNKVVFEVIGDDGAIIESMELEIRYRND